MSFRQDKLVLLIETGTSTQVRRTASKQLVDVCVKIFKAFEKEHEAWPEIFLTISKLFPLLRVKSSETRHAAAHTIGLLAASLPPSTLSGVIPESSPVDVATLIRTGQTLLASAGREYVAKPVGDKAKRKKDMLGSLGLSDAVGWDVDKVIDEDDVKEETASAPTSTPTTPAPKTESSTPPGDIFEGLSARQIMMVKRKKGNMAEEANKMRRLNSAPASSAPTPENASPDSGPVIIAHKEKSGAIEPHETVAVPTLLYSVEESPWTTIASDLIKGLQEPQWEVRHGSALGLLELVRSTTLPSSFLIFLSRRLLVLLSLDKFGDFVGDTVVAPVRETAAQALGISLKYLDVTGVKEVHETLMSMVRQSWAVRGGKGWERFSWEIRHAGLLGLKYEVAVRRDLLEALLEDVKPEVDNKPDTEMKPDAEMEDVKPNVQEPSTLMGDVIDAAILALRDVDDDVRSVAASALIPIVPHLVDLPDLSVLLDALWGCLAEGGDELGSSTAAVMDLLGDLISYERIINTDPRPQLILPFVRHTIASVRLAVVKALLVFIKSSLPTDWMNGDLSSLLFQNLVLEERDDIRQFSLAAFTAVIKVVDPGARVKDWYSIIMTPIGNPLDPTFFIIKQKTLHNVDKHMMACDMSLISVDMILRTRITAARGLALLQDTSPLAAYLESASAHQIFLAALVVQESKTASLAPTLISFIEGPPPPTYHEMLMILNKIHTECQALFTAFNSQGKVAKDKIPPIPSKIDPLRSGPDIFSLDVAKQIIGPQFDTLATSLSKANTSKVLPGLKDRQKKVIGSIGYFSVMKERYDVQVSAAVAGALIALQVMPPKIGPVIRSVMDAVKKEENEILQIRAAESVASFVEYCNSPSFTNKVNPCDKVVKNLFTFLCSDVSVTPVFHTTLEGIVSLEESKKVEVDESEDQIAAKITRRGALEALKAISQSFGPRLFDVVPKYWEGISSALNSDDEPNQNFIDCLTSLRLLAPHIDPSLHHKLVDLFPKIIQALASQYSIVRHVAAKSLAALCDVLTEEGMRRVVDGVVPMVGDATNATSRQGAVEAIHHIIKLLDIKSLPYVLFLIVPILGRMSDPDEPVRLLSTSTFASLIKMVPLEAGLPDPPGFSKELLIKRDEERQFLMQLLDGSKAEQYQIPIPIKADLRQYQKDGVSWLAFLAKYQLHGILCDDMGLGKSLQSICIVGSKHFERAEKFKATKSVDSSHLPSLIVCPPTLVGHWYHEVPKFTDYLRPFQYIGNSYQRAILRPQLQNYDVIITSYEVVRNDIAELGKINWLYCVLDEGHIIKNAKTKLATAVKQIKAQHRLLLSGTPIQNNVLELWSLFDFLMPGFLGSDRVFNDRFSKPILADRDGKATPKERELATSALEALHKQVLPFLLRRLKEDVLSDLPPKIIQDYHCELSDVQKQLYDEFQKSKAADEAGEAVQNGQGQQHVFQSLQYLRKLCNHPALVLDNDPERVKTIMAKLPKGTPPLHDISHAPKLEALKQLLNDCGIGLDKVESSHRVLIFCQLRPMLDIIEKDLFQAVMPSVTYMRMDGNTDPRKRHAVVQTFNGDPNIDVLLLTTSVGGLGLNLTGADTVIFVDHDWNPMKDLQAMDRAHRLGQKKVVNVYRLIMRGTLEDKIMGLQRFKLNIASSVVTQQNSNLGSMNTGEVLDLFKVSAEGETTKQKKESTGPVSSSKVLEGLEDLPPEDEYAELSLENFLSKV